MIIVRDNAWMFLYTCEQRELDFTSMAKVDKHIIVSHDDEIGVEYLEPNLSYTDGRRKYKKVW